MPLLLLFHLPVDLCPTTLSRRTSLGTWKRVEDTAINEREGAEWERMSCYLHVLYAVPRAGAGAKRCRAKPMSLAGEVSRTGGWESCEEEGIPRWLHGVVVATGDGIV